MPEFAVLKRGRFNYSSWSTRVLTLDIPRGVAMLSRKGRPDGADRHVMRAPSVQMWPHYDKRCLDEKFDSLKAKLTLVLRGTHGTDDDDDHPNGTAPRLTSASAPSDEEWVLRFVSLKDLSHAAYMLTDMELRQGWESTALPGDATMSSSQSEMVPVKAQVQARCAKDLQPIREAWLEHHQRKAQDAPFLSW
ncbi:hypothetical protein JKF63_03960 [Porcisia hertigi]|uniref:Uncharacterized protein n=1 Tax=Porcisia hertigi TaxID=2761500 RepID=A0A836HUA5_9TRYP|nr:hypothetical protein JKF63_03960 [Porcisia hertigi]